MTTFLPPPQLTTAPALCGTGPELLRAESQALAGQPLPVITLERDAAHGALDARVQGLLESTATPAPKPASRLVPPDAGTVKLLKAVGTVLTSLGSKDSPAGRRVVERIIADAALNRELWQAELNANAPAAEASGIAVLETAVSEMNANVATGQTKPTPSPAQKEDLAGKAQAFWQQPAAESVFKGLLQRLLLTLESLRLLSQGDTDGAQQKYHEFMVLLDAVTMLSHAPSCPPQLKDCLPTVLWCFYPYNRGLGAWCDCDGAYGYAREVPLAEFMTRLGPAWWYRG